MTGTTLKTKTVTKMSCCSYTFKSWSQDLSEPLTTLWSYKQTVVIHSKNVTRVNEKLSSPNKTNVKLT